MNYYYPNSEPLKTVKQIEHEDIIYDEFGRCCKNLVIKDKSYTVEVCESVLVDGELLSNLTESQLDLFWTLSNKKRQRYEVTDRYQR